MRVALCLSLWILIVPASWSMAQGNVPSESVYGHLVLESGSSCPENLMYLEEEMEELLKSVYVKEFREAIRRSLKASIPEAVSHIDGLKDEMAALQKEITHQVRVEKSAEFILRDITKTTEGPFKPCRRREEGGYCETLERYYMAKAANLANRGFLQALECHQRHGAL